MPVAWQREASLLASARAGGFDQSTRLGAPKSGLFFRSMLRRLLGCGPLRRFALAPPRCNASIRPQAGADGESCTAARKPADLGRDDLAILPPKPSVYILGDRSGRRRVGNLHKLWHTGLAINKLGDAVQILPKLISSHVQVSPTSPCLVISGSPQRANGKPGVDHPQRTPL
jgi:hypothetical protein